jgi:hypothetical protein
MWDSSVPVLMFDSASRRIYCANEAVAALFQTTPREMEGKLVESCIVRPERARLRAALLRRDQPWGDVGHWECVSRDGTHFTVQLRFHQTIYEDELMHVVIATAILRKPVSRSAVAGQGDEFSKCG